MQWDINNEMLHGSFFADREGVAIRDWMYQAAAQVDPDVDLFINDFDIVENGQLTQVNIYICYLPGGKSVWEKTVPEVLSTARGRRPRAVLKTKGTVVSHTDRPSPVNNIFIFFLQYIGFTEY